MTYPIVRFDNTDVSSYVTGVVNNEILMDCPDLPPGEYTVTVITEVGVSNKVQFNILGVIDPLEGFTKISDHSERGLSRLIHQYKRPHIVEGN